MLHICDLLQEMKKRVQFSVDWHMTCRNPSGTLQAEREPVAFSYSLTDTKGNYWRIINRVSVELWKQRGKKYIPSERFLAHLELFKKMRKKLAHCLITYTRLHNIGHLVCSCHDLHP